MNTLKSISIMLVAFASLITSSCIYVDGTVGEGPITSEQCNVSDFTAVELLGSADVEISKGDSFRVVLSDYENLLQYWDIKVVNNTLMIQTRPFTSLITTRAKVSIVMPDQLEKVILSGSGDILIKSAFESLEHAVIEGSGDIVSTTTTNYSTLRLLIAGSGNITLKGTAEEVNTITMGSGRMYLANLAVQEAGCLIAGSGNIYMNVERKLNATISGSGNIYYIGQPEITISDNGSGNLIRQ